MVQKNKQIHSFKISSEVINTQSNFVRGKTIAEYQIPHILLNFKMNAILHMHVRKQNSAINFQQQFMK
jgi:hypothetical protein